MLEPSDTPEALNAELLARNVALERRIVELQAQLAHHEAGRSASVLAAISTKARNVEIDDRDFREFVRRALG